VTGTCSRCDDGRRPCECGNPILPSKTNSTWSIVLYEWQAAQDMSGDSTWYPAAEITRGDGMATVIRYKSRNPGTGKPSYRNVRGPFHWVEPLTSESCDHLPRTTEPNKGRCVYCGIETGVKP
jgi:hypothetical protein